MRSICHAQQSACSHITHTHIQTHFQTHTCAQRNKHERRCKTYTHTNYFQAREHKKTHTHACTCVTHMRGINACTHKNIHIKTSTYTKHVVPCIGLTHEWPHVIKTQSHTCIHRDTYTHTHTCTLGAEPCAPHLRPSAWAHRCTHDRKLIWCVAGHMLTHMQTANTHTLHTKNRAHKQYHRQTHAHNGHWHMCPETKPLAVHYSKKMHTHTYAHTCYAHTRIFLCT
eukprot:GDKI01048541.1.p1 GENE.GDKI01048541.1~~GDKI01048541.1.p1  ORF type:complete len:226 (-),score=56.43 GDKI01048541.1:331-1008(-)